MENPTLRKPEVEKVEAPVEPVVVPPAVDPVQLELKKLREENEAKDKQIADSQRKLSETAAEKATLEAKINSKPPVAEGPDPALSAGVKSALETAQLDPEKGAEELTKLIHQATTRAEKQAVSQALEQVQRQSAFQNEFNAHVKTVKEANKDLDDFEADIARLAAEKMQTERKPYKVAIDEAVADVRKRVEIYKKRIQGEAPAPKGSQGETGGTAPVIKKEEKPSPGDTGESAEDYISLRRQQLVKH